MLAARPKRAAVFYFIEFGAGRILVINPSRHSIKFSANIYIEFYFIVNNNTRRPSMFVYFRRRKFLEFNHSYSLHILCIRG